MDKKNHQYKWSFKKKKTLCNTLNWGDWNSGFVKLVVWWAEQDISFLNYHTALPKSAAHIFVPNTVKAQWYRNIIEQQVTLSKNTKDDFYLVSF